MKTTSKLFTSLSLSVFAGALFVSLPVYAHNGEDDTSGSSNKVSRASSLEQAVICKSFDSITSKTTTEISKRRGSSDGKWTQSASEIQAKRAEWAAKVAAERAEAAKKRADNFAQLEALATTDAQKTAVALYEGKVLAAVAARQAAYDANFEAYFKAVDTLLASQKTNSGGDVDAFKAAVAAAIEKAKTSCTNGVSGEQIKTQLKTDLKTARDSFKSQRTGDKSSIKAQLEAIKKTRKDANTKARETFKTTLEAARTELKAAFPSTDDTTI